MCVKLSQVINDLLSNRQVAIMILFKIFLKSFLPLISSVVRKFHKHRVRQTIKEPITNRNKYRHDCNFSSEAVRNKNSNVKLFGLSYVRIARPLGLHIQILCSTYVYWIRQLVSTSEGYQPDCHAELQEWSRMEEIKYISYGCLSVLS